MVGAPTALLLRVVLYQHHPNHPRHPPQATRGSPTTPPNQLVFGPSLSKKTHTRCTSRSGPRAALTVARGLPRAAQRAAHPRRRLADRAAVGRRAAHARHYRPLAEIGGRGK